MICRLRRVCPVGLIVALSFGLAPSCVVPPKVITLSYRAQAPVERVPDAEKVRVNVSTKDMRENQHYVCAQSSYERQAVNGIESLIRRHHEPGSPARQQRPGC